MSSFDLNQTRSKTSGAWSGEPWPALRMHFTAANATGLLGALLTFALLFALPTPWNIRIPLYLTLALWVLLRPRVALYLLPLSIPWGALDYMNIGPLRLNSTDILVLLLALAWLLSFALRPSEISRGPRDREAAGTPRYLVYAIAALLGAMLLSMSVALSRSDSLKEIFKWLEFALVLLLGAQYIRTRRQLWTLIVFIWLAGISQALLGYLQSFLNLGPENFIRNNSLRVYGTFDQPNPYAGFINIPLSLAIAVFVLGRNWRTRLTAGLVAAILAGAEALSQSKGGLVAIGTATFFVLLMGVPRVRAFGRVMLVGVMGLILGVLAGWVPLGLFSAVSDYVGLTGLSFTDPTPSRFATEERVAHWLAGIHMFQAHPWLGVGIGNYSDAYPSYALGEFVLPLGHAHNYFINVAAEMGIVGLVVYTLFIIATFAAGGRAYRALTHAYLELKARRIAPPRIVAPVGTRNKLALLLHPHRMIAYYRGSPAFEQFGMLINDRALAIGLLASLVAILMHNMVDNLYVQGMATLMALLLVALIRIHSLTLKQFDTGEKHARGDAAR